MNKLLVFVVVGSLLLLFGSMLLLGMMQQAQASGCATAFALRSPADHASPASGMVASCYPGSGIGAQVVAWAARMADALTVNPACGTLRGGACNDTWYTSAFPPQVIRYGQDWCQAHGDCADWANGSYQCVSFVRGAYSQVYPMTLTNDAFGLWATYRSQAGWQEIPAAAASSVSERGLPEPGDVMVFRDVSVGHVAIVMQVQAPVNGRAGVVRFANANSSSAYDQMPLLPDLTVDTSEWAPGGGHYLVWGYIRPEINASRALVRLNQIDPAQYASHNEWSTWAYSACSAAAMTEVLNAYGMHLRIHDVLTVEASLGEITPTLGLVEEVGIATTLRHFGFHTTWGDQWTLTQVVAVANSGEPVIVSWPPSRYAGGHIVVVAGGDLSAGVIRLADSSLWNRQAISVAQFLQWWAGFAAVASPGA